MQVAAMVVRVLLLLLQEFGLLLLLGWVLVYAWLLMLLVLLAPCI